MTLYEYKQFLNELENLRRLGVKGINERIKFVEHQIEQIEHKGEFAIVYYDGNMNVKTYAPINKVWLYLCNINTYGKVLSVSEG